MAEEEKKVELDKPVVEEIQYKRPKRMSLHSRSSEDNALKEASALEKMVVMWGEMYEQIIDEGKCFLYEMNQCNRCILIQVSLSHLMHQILKMQ